MTTKNPTSKPDPHWYVLETAAGDAEKVAESLKNSLQKIGLQGQVLEIRCPLQEVGTPPADGTAPVPGFFLARMVWNPTVWGKLRSFEGVTGFLGENNMPVPVTDTEIAFVTRQMSRPRKTKKVIRISGDGHDE